jgi:hypothetical protein
VRNAVISYKHAEFETEINIRDMELSDLASFIPGQASRLQLAGQFDGADIRLAGKIKPFDANPEFNGSLKLQAADLERYKELLPPAIQGLQGIVDLSSRLELRYEPSGILHAAGKLTLGNKETGFSMTYRDVNINAGKIAWDGAVTYEPGIDGGMVVAAGELGVESLLAVSSTTKYTLLSFNSMDMRDINTRLPGTFSFAKTEFIDMTLGKQAIDTTSRNQADVISLAEYGRLELDEMHYSSSDGLSIKTIVQNDVRHTIQKTEDGRWNMVRFLGLFKTLTARKQQQDSEAVVTADENRPTPLRIGLINISGDSILRIEDRHVEPAYAEEFRIDKARLENLDSREPQRPGTLELAGVLGKNTRLELTGGLAPFARRLTADIKGELHGLSLPPLSPYSSRLLGYDITSGEMDATIQFKSDNGVLNGNNEIKLYKIEVEPAIAKESQQSAKHDVSLEKGLALLRDKQGNIKMDLPITGDVDNFKIDPSDAINQAIARAIKFSAKTYLTAALFPYGTLLTLVEAAGSKAMEVNLDPVIYAPGTSTLSDQNKLYLVKIASVLKQRPEMQIKLCGIATESDRTALLMTNGKKLTENAQKKPSVSDEQLKSLALERADVIEAHMIDLHRIESKRLISCQPRIDSKGAEAQPRTELSI